jgi:hypothetical protein
MSAKTQQELIDLHWNEPQLEIIDRAIESIEKGRYVFCCLAIYRSVGRALAEHKIDYNSKWAIARLYQSQFARFCLNSKKKLPRWWNSAPAPTTKSDDSKLFVLSAKLASTPPKLKPELRVQPSHKPYPFFDAKFPDKNAPGG